MDAELLITLQKEKAYRFLKEADDMLEQKRWDLAANRYYYACYHMTHAAFISKGISTRTHDGTLTELGKNFKKFTVYGLLFTACAERFFQMIPL